MAALSCAPLQCLLCPLYFLVFLKLIITRFIVTNVQMTRWK